MKSALLNPLNIRWLIDPAADESTDVIDTSLSHHRQSYPFPPEIGQGWMERLLLSNDIVVFQGVHRFAHDVKGQLLPLAEFQSDLSEPTLVVQTVTGGLVCHDELNPPARLIYKPGYDLFRFTKQIHVIPLVDSSHDSTMTSVFIPQSALIGLVGQDLAQQLLSLLGLYPLGTVKVLAMSLQVSAALRACVSDAYRGEVKLLFAQSKVLEYLSVLATHLGATSPERRSQNTAIAVDQRRSHQGKQLARDLHNHLAHIEGKLPSLPELAARYDVSERWLNETFKQVYGESIFLFMADHRLKQAHAALERSAVPIKLIAGRMGYSHVNHFTNAFKKKFGYPPGSVRRVSLQA
jgi:AraC-like DNA-binding protein